MNNIIDGDNIYLRPIDMEDTGNIIKWRNDNEVRCNFIYQKDFTEESHMHWMKNYVFQGKATQYIIVDKILNNSIGSVYFRDIDYVNKIAEYGIFIGNSIYRGRGVGTTVAKMFIQYGFNELKLEKIFLRVFSDNYCAIKSYKNAGFKENGKSEIVLIGGKQRKVMFMEIKNKSLLSDSKCLQAE